MRQIEPLITPAEAVDLFGYSEFTMIGSDVGYAYLESRNRERIDLSAAFCCIWNAGRIQGIREERRARKEKKIASAMHQKPIGRVPIGGGRTVPLFDLGPSYINTSEGWKLYGAYLDAKRAYDEGKRAFEEAHK